MQFNFGPPEFLSGQAACPKCRTPLSPDEERVDCPVCFTAHHRRCVAEGVACGNEGCAYVFYLEDGQPEIEAFRGPERRREADRRRAANGSAPDGVERRQGDRRRSDF